MRFFHGAVADRPTLFIDEFDQVAFSVRLHGRQRTVQQPFERLCRCYDLGLSGRCPRFRWLVAGSSLKRKSGIVQGEWLIVIRLASGTAA